MDFLDFLVVVALLPFPGCRPPATGEPPASTILLHQSSIVYHCPLMRESEKLVRDCSKAFLRRFRKGRGCLTPPYWPSCEGAHIRHGMAWRGGAGVGRPKTSNNQALLGPWPGGFRLHPPRLRCDAKACRLRSLGPRPRTLLNLKSVLQARKTGHSPSTRDPGLEMTAS